MIQIISSLAEFSLVQKEWDEIAKKYCTPLLSFAWFYNCAQYLYKENKISIVIYRENNKIKSILPLVLVSEKLTPYFEILGSSFLFEPSGDISENNDSLLKLLKELIKSLKLPINLNRVSNSFNSIKISSLKVLQKNATSSSYIKIETEWDSFYNNLKSRRKSDYRRALKKANSYGIVKTEIFKPNTLNFKKLFDQAKQIEAAGWKGEKKSALLFNRKLDAFFRNYLGQMCKSENVRIAFLTVDDQQIAMLIGVVFCSRFWIFKIGYNEEYSNCSPGILLTMETIKYAFEQNFNSYEFLGSYENWQNMWPIEIQHYTSLTIYPYTFNSLLHFGFSGFQHLLGKIGL